MEKEIERDGYRDKSRPSKGQERGEGGDDSPEDGVGHAEEPIGQPREQSLDYRYQQTAVNHCGDGVDDILKQPLLMFVVHRQQPPKPRAEIRAVAQKEKQRKQRNREINREDQNDL